MTDFIPFGTPPGSTGNPKQLPGDVFSVGDVIKCSVTGTVAGVTPVVVSDTATVAAPTTIGTVTVTGSTTPETGTEETYTVTFDGDAADATYSWSVSPATATIDVNTGTNTAGITFDADDTYTVTVTVTSATATDSPVDGSLSSIVSTTPVRNSLTWTATMPSATYTGGTTLQINCSGDLTGEDVSPDGRGWEARGSGTPSGAGQADFISSADRRDFKFRVDVAGSSIGDLSAANPSITWTVNGVNQEKPGLGVLLNGIGTVLEVGQGGVAGEFNSIYNTLTAGDVSVITLEYDPLP